MKNFKYFNNETAYNSERNGNYEEPWVSWTDGKGVDYNKTNREKPLTFRITRAGNINWKSGTNSKTNTIKYKKNNSDWISITSKNTGSTISVVSGDVIQFKGTNGSFYYSYYDDGTVQLSSGFKDCTCQFTVEGNIMSIINESNFQEISELTSGNTYVFWELFKGCTGLIDVSNLIIPATTLQMNCYNRMFKGCTGLTNVSKLKLPATTLADSCYSNMFEGCTGLTMPPTLPATTLNWNCYRSMFSGCTSLVTAPELPATTLAKDCYDNMFQGCTSLTTAPVLPATTLTVACYQYMFEGCTGLTTAPELPGTYAVDACYRGMFKDCTGLTTAPTLPRNAAQNCYSHMFQGCTNLTTAPELPATNLPTNCYEYMFYGCTSLTTAPELPATRLDNYYCYRYMFYGCSSLNYIKAMFTTTPSNSYTQNWVDGVSATGTFVKNASATWTTTGTNGVPSGWTIQTATE